MELKTEWPTKPCGRCGGSGHYSFNRMDGTICYGCGGKKVQPMNSKVATVMASWLTLLDNSKRPLWRDIQAGDEIAKDGQWVEVLSVETTDKEYGRAFYNNELRHIYYGIQYTLADGTTKEVPENETVRRRSCMQDAKAALLETAWTLAS